MKKISIYIAIITGIIVLIGFGFKFDGRYAKARVIQQLEQRLDMKILEDKRANIQNRMWKLENR